MLFSKHLYDLSEQLYKLHCDHHSKFTDFSPTVFERKGFPTDFNSLPDLLPLINSMQDGRARKYFTECSQYFESDRLEAVTECVSRFLRDVINNYIHRGLNIPLDDIILSHVAAAKNISSLNIFNNQKINILEIGPGTGILPLCFDTVKQKDIGYNYYSVESTPSFYALQNLILFEMTRAHSSATQVDCANGLERRFFEYAHDLAIGKSPYFDRSVGSEFAHFPYWELGNIDGHLQGRRINVLVANACLNEIQIPALNKYLDVISQVLDKNAILYIQNTGLQHDRRNIMKILSEKGFRLIVATMPDAVVRCQGGANLYTAKDNYLFIWDPKSKETLSETELQLLGTRGSSFVAETGRAWLQTLIVNPRVTA